MDTGAGFQPDAFTWSFDEVLEANASAFGRGYNGMMERIPEYETKPHQHIGLKATWKNTTVSYLGRSEAIPFTRMASATRNDVLAFQPSVHWGLLNIVQPTNSPTRR